MAGHRVPERQKATKTRARMGSLPGRQSVSVNSFGRSCVNRESYCKLSNDSAVAIALFSMSQWQRGSTTSTLGPDYSFLDVCGVKGLTFWRSLGIYDGHFSASSASS